MILASTNKDEMHQGLYNPHCTAKFQLYASFCDAGLSYPIPADSVSIGSSLFWWSTPRGRTLYLCLGQILSHAV